MTEAAHQMTSNPLPPGKRQPGSVGLGQGVEVRILDTNGNEVPQGQEAEICVRGDNVTKGYLNNPSANASSFTADGFFRTGDQGKKDADGYVIITGRIKELINKGGEKISPIELDNTLLHHPKVAEAVCFAIPDEGHYGEDIGAAVVLKSRDAATEEELKAWVESKLAKFKTPKKVGFHPPFVVALMRYGVTNWILYCRCGWSRRSLRRRRVRFNDGKWQRRCSRSRRSCRKYLY